MTVDPAKKKQAAKVVRGLRRDYADVECALIHDTPFQLLVATVLSAQCTDERVNIVTKELFAKYPRAKDLAAVPVKEIEKLVQSTGFFRNKAKNIKALSERLTKEFDGEVPQDLDILVNLPGVGVRRRMSCSERLSEFRLASWSTRMWGESASDWG